MQQLWPLCAFALMPPMLLAPTLHALTPPGYHCPSTPNLCSECCADTDCPNQYIGQKCVWVALMHACVGMHMRVAGRRGSLFRQISSWVQTLLPPHRDRAPSLPHHCLCRCISGYCSISSYNCTTFTCWSGSSNQVCKINPTGGSAAAMCAGCSATGVVRCPDGYCCSSSSGCVQSCGNKFCSALVGTGCPTSPTPSGRTCDVASSPLDSCFYNSTCSTPTC